MSKSIYESYVDKHSYLFTGCTDCSNPGATIDKTYSEDGKWITITKLCENCKEARRLKKVFKAATCGPTNIDANGSQVDP